MWVSQKAEYALKAMVELSRQTSPGQTVRSADIARKQNVPEKFLELILVELRRAGLVLSQRGQTGGHRLAREASRISVGEIWRAMDGEISERRNGRENDAFAFLWREVDSAVNEIVNGVSLEDMRKRIESGQTVADFNI